MFDSSEKITKHKINVEIDLEDGKRLVGCMFIKPQERLTDMMNDARMFLPFETADGRFMLIKKTACVSVAPVAEAGATYEGNNPYQILGVSDNATLEEIKARYHALCAENHPDRLSSMGVSQQLIDLATTNMSRINDAWSRIQKQFEENSQASTGDASAA